MRSANGFSRYVLRTSDADAARRFYEAVLGPGFWGPSLFVGAMPERVRAAGAPPHWLGQIRGMDVDATIRAMASEGGQQLGPSRINEDGSVTVILRDPFGALFSCCGRSPSGPAADPVSSAEVAPAEAQPVGWHVHLSRGRAAASALYARLFGWDVRDEVEATPPFGRCTPFAIDAASPSVGVMADAGDDRRVHTQWLHFFLVNDLEGALARVRASGGLVVMTAPGPGGVFAPCDDPQGAAFGLMQQP